MKAIIEGLLKSTVLANDIKICLPEDVIPGNTIKHIIFNVGCASMTIYVDVDKPISVCKMLEHIIPDQYDIDEILIGNCVQDLQDLHYIFIRFITK